MSEAQAKPAAKPLGSSVEGALKVTIVGVGLTLVGGIGSYYKLKPAALLLLLGVAVVAGGGISVVFASLATRSVEWLLAWRYLRHDRRGSRQALWIGLFLIIASLLVAIGVKTFGFWWRRPLLEGAVWVRVLEWASYGGFILGSWVLFFGILLRSGFSMFTTISIFGVFIGTCALVIVLSVMGGFKQDIRSKILGTRAHVVVTKPRKMFEEYAALVDRLSKVPGAVAVSPYLESEVMITSQSNLSGVLLRGIDPDRISGVTDLNRYLRNSGGLDNLKHPEELAKIPQTPYKHMITEPLGEVVAIDGGHGNGQGDADGAKDIGSPKAKGKAKQKSNGVATNKATAEPTSQNVQALPTTRPPRPVLPGVLVGAELARNLRLYIGDDVNLIAPLGGMSPAGPIPKSRPFRVAGIFFSGMYEYDTKYAYVTIETAQRFLGLDDEVTGIEVKGRSADEAAPLADAVRKDLGKDAQKGYVVKDWLEMNRSLLSALMLEKVVMFVALVFIVLVASLSIITNLVMVVLEKRREIAVLKAVGATHRSLVKVFVFAGVYIGVIGVLVGILQGVGICVFLGAVGLPLDPEVWYISQLPVRLDIWEISFVGVVATGLSFAATIYPAIMASNVGPVEGLRIQG